MTELKRGDRAIVSEVRCSPQLKERLRALNVSAGGVVHILKISLFKKVFLLQAGGNRLAVRREVAQCIGVRKV